MSLVLIFIIGFAASVISAMVGGGGLLSIPLLVTLGFTPQSAIATSRLGGIGLCLGAISKYWRENRINWKLTLFLSLLSIPGVYIGTRLLISVNEETMSKAVGIIILVMLPLIIFQKQILALRKEVKQHHKVIGYIIYALIGLYSGFFGAGTGTLSRYDLMLAFKLGIVDANASDFMPGLISTIISASMLWATGLIDFKAGITLFVAMIIGGYLGAHIAVKRDGEWLRWAFVSITFIMGIKLLFWG